MIDFWREKVNIIEKELNTCDDILKNTLIQKRDFVLNILKNIPKISANLKKLYSLSYEMQVEADFFDLQWDLYKSLKEEGYLKLYKNRNEMKVSILSV